MICSFQWNIIETSYFCTVLPHNEAHTHSITCTVLLHHTDVKYDIKYQSPARFESIVFLQSNINLKAFSYKRQPYSLTGCFLMLCMILPSPKNISAVCAPWSQRCPWTFAYAQELNTCSDHEKLIVLFSSREDWSWAQMLQCLFQLSKQMTLMNRRAQSNQSKTQILFKF